MVPANSVAHSLGMPRGLNGNYYYFLIFQTKHPCTIRKSLHNDPNTDFLITQQFSLRRKKERNSQAMRLIGPLSRAMYWNLSHREFIVSTHFLQRVTTGQQDLLRMPFAFYLSSCQNVFLCSSFLSFHVLLDPHFKFAPILTPLY